ncbi:MAG: Wzz/FepE/Etk N-terminal domain-containing protein [Bacilli bacterium]|nr:Wzz/FepE/Etk N-terminal domain-containing protein [Clostridium sp.]MDY3798659.1 Wzz/FepE/Etk N-terminal domain-containing protein [Bacilli bacterium]CDE95157.1 lipopolysaccharide biosynthesis protein [Clostridium sp. CAG:914]
MEEIDLKELFEFIKKKIGLLITITVVICLLGCIYGLFIQKPMYKSYTTIILGGNETTASQTITQSDITLNKNLVDTYAEIVKSRRVLEQVIAELDLEETYEELSNKISVSSVNNTEIIKITVADSNPIEAKNVANVTANFFSKEVVKLYNMNNVNVLDEANEANEPYNINIPKQVIIYFFIGIIIALSILFIIFYFDRTIKSVEQVEQKIKLPILGGVEEYKKGGKRK